MEVKCQGCGKNIEKGEHTVRVSYGQLRFTAHPHVALNHTEIDDWFHDYCEKAFRSPKTVADKMVIDERARA